MAHISTILGEAETIFKKMLDFFKRQGEKSVVLYDFDSRLQTTRSKEHCFVADLVFLSS